MSERQSDRVCFIHPIDQYLFIGTTSLNLSVQMGGCTTSWGHTGAQGPTGVFLSLNPHFTVLASFILSRGGFHSTPSLSRFDLRIEFGLLSIPDQPCLPTEEHRLRVPAKHPRMKDLGLSVGAHQKSRTLPQQF